MFEKEITSIVNNYLIDVRSYNLDQLVTSEMDLNDMGLESVDIISIIAIIENKFKMNLLEMDGIFECKNIRDISGLLKG